MEDANLPTEGGAVQAVVAKDLDPCQNEQKGIVSPRMTQM